MSKKLIFILGNLLFLNVMFSSCKMGSAQVVTSFFAAAEAKNWDAAAKLLSDEVKFEWAGWPAIGKDAWLKMQKTFATAIPDWKFNLKELVADGGVVNVKTKVTGTHNGTMDLREMMNDDHMLFEKTGNKLQFSDASYKISVKKEKIALVQVFGGDSIMDLLVQMGYKPEPITNATDNITPTSEGDKPKAMDTTSAKVDNSKDLSKEEKAKLSAEMEETKVKTESQGEKTSASHSAKEKSTSNK